VQSLSHLLNFSPGEYRPEMVRDDAPGFEFALRQNRYLSQLAQQGYSARVYQSGFLDMCPEGTPAVCDTYAAAGLAVLRDVPVSTTERARMIAATYWTRSTILDRTTGWLPVATWFHRTASHNGLHAMKRLMRDLSGATRGELYLAHLLFPHSPRVYGDDCGLMPFERWSESAPTPLDTRTMSYGRYGRQVRCAVRLLHEIVDSIPPSVRSDAILIVHGDHGSRIRLVNTPKLIAEEMSADDYRSVYSTLFAVRSPAIAAGSDHRFVPITCLLRSLVADAFAGTPDLDGCVAEPAVFVPGRDGVTQRRPLAPFDKTSRPRTARPAWRGRPGRAPG
jgi:hypothetical protein